MTPPETPEGQEQASGTPHSGEEGDARPCDWCGTPFKPYRDWQRHCQPACRKAAWRAGNREQAKQEIVERVVNRVRADVVEAVEQAFEDLTL